MHSNQNTWLMMRESANMKYIAVKVSVANWSPVRRQPSRLKQSPCMHIISSLSSPIPDIVLRLGICWHCQGHPRTGKKIQTKNPVVLRFRWVQTVMESSAKNKRRDTTWPLQQNQGLLWLQSQNKRGAPVNPKVLNPKLHSCPNSLQRKPQMLHILAHPNRLFSQCYANSAKG